MSQLHIGEYLKSADTAEKITTNITNIRKKTRNQSEYKKIHCNSPIT